MHNLSDTKGFMGGTASIRNVINYFKGKKP